MKVSIQNSTLLDNREVLLFRLKNSCGAYIEITNYGATLVSAVIPDYKELPKQDFRYKNLEAYFADEYYVGTTIGRIANRFQMLNLQSMMKFTI